MGIISRRVLPLCGHLCVCCPGLRARSRQPVKRYKKLLSDLFPKSQAEQPNDRKISKLTDYAVKNPFRIPKIAKNLELRGYKELRHEHYGSVRVIMRTFFKLFSTCKDQMPLLAVSALNMIHVLLEQQNDEMRVLGCVTVVEFIYQQVDTTYMHNLDSFIPKFCALARETGPEPKRSILRAAGLQALSAMLWFMGEFSHMPSDFDEIVRAVLMNYEATVTAVETEGGEREPAQNLVKGFLKGSVMRDALARMSFNMESIRIKYPRNLTKEESETPKVWSQICVQNMACLGKETTTIRCVLDAAFNYFDSEKSWSLESGIALPVLRDMVFLMEKTGNDHLVLGALVRHLDHKNVANELPVKTEIVRVTTVLARHSKPKSKHSEVGIINDLSRHLRRSLQLSLEMSSGVNMEHLNDCLQAIERCLIELARRIGEATPILEQMAVILEKLSSKNTVARTTIEAVAVLAHIVVSLPNEDLHIKAFPEALLYQLLRAMVHPDVETRLGCHHIFFVLLIPPSGGDAVLVKSDVKVLFRTPSSAASSLFEKVMKDKQKSVENIDEFKDAEESLAVKDTSVKEVEMTPARLSGYQASLLLSSLLIQATMADNVPVIFEALGHTFSLTLLFSRPKTSSNNTCIRAFQLALTLRTLALDPSAVKSSCQRRSLFTLSTVMLIVAATIYDVPHIIPLVKANLTAETRDPFLEVTEDNKLKLCSGANFKNYGSIDEERSAAAAMSQISIPPDASNETIASMIVKLAPPHLEMSGPEQLLQKFTPDDTLVLGSKIHLEAFNGHMGMESMSFDDVVPSADEDALSPMASIGLPPLLADVPVPPPAAMGVNQLLESALEAAGQVASITTPNSPVSYHALASQCEAFVAGTRKNMSIVMRLDSNLKPSTPSADAKGKWTQAIGSRSKSLNESPVFSPPWLTPSADETWPLVKLPPASPYDNFLKAAGC
ncbi:uncharacterized protein LOC9650285 [Selaginella moellendorffii]|uniref:uncharacterized protein LOC9650285 n=1 Tax=Selaginella moellendorffii TaxID=88036 RepID=UPI000D1C5416|nr:uncharacterized protein LOC9650285 [Selaginella moellendorffii]|eukprot:XP_024528944.1 uncharacterized protein LOC9650285 [Selaginella moellendorffii]